MNNLNKRWVAILIAIVVLLIAWKAFVPRGKYGYGFPMPDGGGWQAVFLTNDQVYFGKLQSLSREYVALDQIFYLRVAQPLQVGAAGQPALNLVKLGGELHGPTDAMYIPKDKIMFWENLRGDSQVVQAITNFYAQQ